MTSINSNSNVLITNVNGLNNLIKRTDCQTNLKTKQDPTGAMTWMVLA